MVKEIIKKLKIALKIKNDILKKYVVSVNCQLAFLKQF
jgi:hypothetical protein